MVGWQDGGLVGWVVGGLVGWWVGGLVGGTIDGANGTVASCPLRLWVTGAERAQERNLALAPIELCVMLGGEGVLGGKW